MRNCLVDNVPESEIEATKQRIEETKKVISEVKNKKTKTYIKAMVGLKNDYEYVSDFENADKQALECINILMAGEIKMSNDDYIDMVLSCLDTRARLGNFDSFCIALEWNRPPSKQFYLPRRRLLIKHGIVDAVQDLIDDKLDLLVLNEPPRVGKSTIGIYLQVLLGGMYPDESLLGAGHSMSLVQSFYNEVLNIITNREYRYGEIFPNNIIVDKNAEYNYLDLNTRKRFHTYNYVSIETGGTGKVQAERLLYCDDLIKGVEQANNPQVLDNLYLKYTSTIKDRKIQRLCKDGKYRPCPELHINTPWSINDITNRVINNAKMKMDESRVRIIQIPCYDENGESNFLYDYGKGFSKEYYKDMEVAEDPVIFSAKYLMKPIERDGLVFNKDNISFYENLPGDEPDYICAYGDVTHGGDDYFSMPVGYVYGNEVYIEDVLFINKFGGDNASRPLVCNMIVKNKVTRCGFEKNNGGDFYSTLINNDLRKRNYYCNILSYNAPTNKKKRDRILAVQEDIKGVATESNTFRIYFKSPSSIKGNKMYQDAMTNLYNWNQNVAMQNKQHDDFPDSLAGMITNIIGSGYKGRARTIDVSKVL